MIPSEEEMKVLSIQREGEFKTHRDMPDLSSLLKVNAPQLMLTGIGHFLDQDQVNAGVSNLVGKTLVLLHPTWRHIMRRQILLGAILLSGFTCLGNVANAHPSKETTGEETTGENRGHVVHVLAGLANYDDDGMSFRHDNPVDPSVSATNELTDVGYLGASRQIPLTGEHLQFGLEAGALFGYGSEKERASATGGGGGKISTDIRNTLITGEIFFGGYVGTQLGQRVRLHAGAGPVAYVGWMSQETKDSDEDSDFYKKKTRDDTGFGYGWYARTGIDFLINDLIGIGVSVRYVDGKINFSDPIDNAEPEGTQFFLTYSVAF
jgi:opacity protein-like surface antigen